MKLNPIINSLLDQDCYKYSMGQCIFHQHQNKQTHWSFKCRNTDVEFTPEMVQEIKEQVEHYCSLRYTEEELQYLLDSCKWLHKDYIDYLRFWHPRMENIFIGMQPAMTEKQKMIAYAKNEPIEVPKCGLMIEIDGSATEVSPYETPIMSIVTEVYYRMSGNYPALEKAWKDELGKKLIKMKDGTYDLGTFSEFGMRRRLSFETQDFLISQLKDIPGFVGTSDVLLAKKYGVKAVGTMAHEFVMLVGQGYPERNPAYSNKFMMDSWVKEYGILNGIALTDTIGTPVFLRDFQLTYATLFSGVRHDSGDPIAWGDKMIEHYKSLGIDPTTKTLLFSDSLDGERATKINNYFKGKAKVAFGIGTWFSGPVEGALNIVIKTTAVDGQPVAKLSDASGKNMCKDPAYIEYLKKAVDWRLNH